MLLRFLDCFLNYFHLYNPEYFTDEESKKHKYFENLDTSEGYHVYFSELFFKDVYDIQKIEEQFPDVIFFEILEGAIIQFMANDIEDSLLTYPKNHVRPL